MSDTPGWTSPGVPDDPGHPAGGGASPWPPPPGPAPAYGQPGYGQPGYGTPGYGTPGYGQPAPAWAVAPQAPKPGVVPLRPLGVGEILDGAVNYIRRNPRATLGLAAVIAAVALVMQLVVLDLAQPHLVTFGDQALQSSSGSSGPTISGTSGGAQLARLLQGLVDLFLELLVTGMLTFVMSQAVLGRSVTAGAAWAKVKPLFWRLVGTVLLTALIITGVIAGSVVPGVLLVLGGAGVGGVLVVVLGVLLAVPLAIWVGVALSLAPAALVLESSRPVAALRRSRALVEGSWWRIFGITLLAGLIASLIAGVIEIPFALLGGGLGAISGGADPAFRGLLFAVALGGAVASVVTLPFRAGVTSLLYIDRRMRREGLDLALVRAAGLGGPPTGATPPPGYPPSGAPPPGTQQW